MIYNIKMGNKRQVKVMDMQQLRYFVCVAEHLNFSKAAKYLYISQPSLSQGIAKLEQILGLQLFYRDRRSVRLTPAGAVFLKEAVVLIDRAEEAVNKAREASQNFAGTLKIGFLPSLGKKHLPHWIDSFRQKFPNVGINLYELTMSALHTALEVGDMDIGYTRSFGLQNTDDYAWREIYSENMVLVMRRDHPLVNETAVSFAALANYPFVMLAQEEAPQWFRFVMQVCANRGVSLKVVDRPKRVEGVLTLVEAGIGIAMVPASNKTKDTPNLCFKDILGEDTGYQVVLAWKKSRDNPAISLLLNEVDAQTVV